MAEAPWITIIGLGEDGPAGLSPACQEALADAEVVMGPARHLDLLVGDLTGERIVWPVPFARGLPLLERQRGRRVVVLASGDPFWFGAGSVLARHFARGDWRALPGPSVFSLVAARQGWPLEQTQCVGLHAAPLDRLAPYLAADQRLIVLLRDGQAVGALATHLEGKGFGDSRLAIGEAVGGAREIWTDCTAATLPQTGFHHPVTVAVEVLGTGAAIPAAAGRPDRLFDHDGQITKRPVRALTLSALAPVPGEHLWDIGGGSGSIAIEWLLAHPAMTATSFERDAARAARITANARALGVDRLKVVEGSAPEVLAGHSPPQAVFVGGGLSEALLGDLQARCGAGTRLVANAVTLEAESLLSGWSARLGGSLMRIDIAQAAPLGAKRGWKAAYPIVQWSVVL